MSAILSDEDALALPFDASALKREQDALWAKLSDPACRLAYCLSLVSDRTEQKTQRDATLFFRAGVILGLAGERVRGLFRVISRRGGVEKAMPWLTESGTLARIAAEHPAVGTVGYVYHARVIAYPHVLKVGFSVSPSRRMKEIEKQFGEPVELLSVRVGTFLDEAREHVDAGRRYIMREFVFEPAFDDVRPGRIPPFLLGPLAHVAED